MVELAMSWVSGCCRGLHGRCGRKAEHFLAFVDIAGALI
jgi:hypothetical protein